MAKLLRTPRCVVTERASGPRRVHADHCVGPPRTGNLDVRLLQTPRALLKDVEEHDEVLRTPIDDTKEPLAMVASQLPEFAFNLGTVRKGERRSVCLLHIEAFDLIMEAGTDLGSELPAVLVNGFDPVLLAVVDGLNKSLTSHQSEAG
jgi:hypothetical protein